MINARLFRFILNGWPPFWGAGIRVKAISSHYHYAKVIMKLHFYNRNFLKVHFGGSIFAMVDPFPSIQLIQLLGPTYIVWDKSADIDFISPGRTTLIAECQVTEDQITMIKNKTHDGAKYLFPYQVTIKDMNGTRVALINKILYIRKKSVL